ncbi:Iron-sulfur cluster insertion protein ErpA [Candidatus Trichorickettsia mobilis]|uniref:Iron-sulfur cluster insertion protein ErpA n=1 Tax=Candidatus Trichorickettsia mobilis TaxID=1346319 RepID=A0ABZ0USM1_9RICK|nr:iron-sulfur cluster assembly accessory protein [Candidatus Trichorickettsia mobilis]WPY00643.1 Iron-sulfur cluster insertion protein ErpA [Candidatus Trichorickettsia mobilis]
MYITATNNAFKRIKVLQPDIGMILRISVDGGGCSGFQYKYEFVSEITKKDYIIVQDDIKIAIDEVSMQYMSGCIIDFVEELGTSYFEIKNPKATGKCGCGNSFSV